MSTTIVTWHVVSLVGFTDVTTIGISCDIVGVVEWKKQAALCFLGVVLLLVVLLLLLVLEEELKKQAIVVVVVVVLSRENMRHGRHVLEKTMYWDRHWIGDGFLDAWLP